MEKSEIINELAAALSKAQGVITPAIKDSNNPFFKSKYADLAAVWDVCRDALSVNGLSVIQLPSAEANAVTLETVLTHGSGQWISSKLTMVSKDATPQAIGSCITYLRRYALSSVVGIASEIDDDGNAATHSNKGFAVKDPSDIPYEAAPVVREVVPAAVPVTMRSLLEKEACKKFKSLDAFQIWRVENGLVESLDSLVDKNGKENGIEFAKIIRAVQQYGGAK